MNRGNRGASCGSEGANDATEAWAKDFRQAWADHLPCGVARMADVQSAALRSIRPQHIPMVAAEQGCMCLRRTGEAACAQGDFEALGKEKVVTHENKTLRRWFASQPCEICPYP